MPYHTSNNRQNTSPANASGAPVSNTGRPPTSPIFTPSQTEELEPVRDVLTSYDVDNTTDVIIDSISTEQLENNFDVNTNDSLLIQDLSSKTIEKTFGRKDDYVELHIYNSNQQKIFSDLNFTDYTIPPNQPCFPLSRHIGLDPKQILNNKGFITGKYTLKINILKKKIFDSDNFPFSIKEISSNRRELRTISNQATNAIFDPAVSSFITELESSVYFKEFSLNFGDDILVPSINVLLNKNPFKHELLIKTLDPLPSDIKVGKSFKVVEEIIDSISINVNLGDPVLVSESTPILGPNFTLNIKQNNSVPSTFKSYNEILKYNVTSSYQHLLSKLEDNSAEININYDFIRTVHSSSIEVPYHFENFTHFGSALERLKNFEYKLKLIELYDNQINTIASVPGDTSGSALILSAKEDKNKLKEKLIKSFDGYEQFLYFTSGSKYTWPKQNNTKPYHLYSITSSQAKTWLGSEISSKPNYGGQLLSASLYDRQNVYNLNKLIPAHIIDNDDNNLYVNFVNMIGQHFDHIWTYIKAYKDINNNDNDKGISKDLVYLKLKDLGIESFDQFENASLTEYMLGTESGSNYSVGFTYGPNHYASGSDVPSETLVTASNDAAIPKGDIAKEIQKRLYHNAPHLLKSKGTERGIRALMSCYGIPSTILNIKEYGGSTTVKGPLKDIKLADHYKTFTYEKSSLYLNTTDVLSNTQYLARFPWEDNDLGPLTEKSIELRILPKKGNNGTVLALANGPNVTNSSLRVRLDKYTGNDISSSGDASTYGRLKLIDAGVVRAETDYFPLYNGNFWNIHLIGVSGSSGVAGGTNNIRIGAYQANYLKNVSKYTANYTSSNYETYFGKTSGQGKTYLYAGTFNYTGGIQELKCHWGEELTDSTLTKHALEPFMYSGNTVSSSFSNVIIRLPLGSTDVETLENHPPDTSLKHANTVADTNATSNYLEFTEDHYLPTPDTVGASMTSEKVRIDEGTIDSNILSAHLKVETSTLDRQPPDYEDLGVFLSPTNELNEDILYTLGSFRMDDYIGSPLPSAQTASKYEDLSTLRDIYFKKVERRFNYWDYVKTIQYLDHTLFKMIEQFVPFRSNLKTGLLIEPHFLERNKFKRTLPVRSDAQTAIPGTHQNFEVQLTSEYGENRLYTLPTGSKAFGIGNVVNQEFEPGNYVVYHGMPTQVTGSNGRRIEQGTNTTILVHDDYLDPSLQDKNAENNQSSQAPIKPFNPTTGKPANYIAHESSVLLGNVIGGKKSKKYYKYKTYYLKSSSLY